MIKQIQKPSIEFHIISFLFPTHMHTLDYGIPIIMISLKCVIAGLGRGWNPMQRLRLCAMLNDRAYINMKSIQLSLMELSSVILYAVISGPWADPQ